MFSENKISSGSFLRLRWYELVIALVIVSVVCIWLMSNLWIKPGINRRVFWTKQNVSSLRLQIGGFKKLEGRYPNSLSELRDYSQKNYGWSFGEVYPLELISDPCGNSKEFTAINGQGGLYYDSNTGQVRVNLIKPVSNYVKSYFGKVGNEAPVDW